MKNYSKILVAVDFSELSESAARRAVEFVKFYGAQLVLLHVIEHFPEHLPHYHMAHEDMDPKEFLVDRARKDLDQMCGKLDCIDAEKKVIVSKHSARGELLDYTEQYGIDLIVLGSHGHHRLNELIAGSTATGIVRSAKCDVFIVRDPG